MINMAQNRRPTVLKTTPPPHARRFCGAAHQSCAARDGLPMGHAAEWWRSSAHLRPIWLARWLPVVPHSPPRRPNTRAIAYDRAAREHYGHEATLNFAEGEDPIEKMLAAKEQKQLQEAAAFNDLMLSATTTLTPQPLPGE